VPSDPPRAGFFVPEAIVPMAVPILRRRDGEVTDPTS
jgi:hypothetical protein